MKDDIQSEIAEALNTDLSDAVTNFTGTKKVAQSSWNSVVHTENHYQGRGVFDAYSSYEADGQTIRISDVKLSCLQNEVTDTPETGDKINGYDVLQVGKDPVGATWIIQLRKV